MKTIPNKLGTAILVCLLPALLNAAPLQQLITQDGLKFPPAPGDTNVWYYPTDNDYFWYVNSTGMDRCGLPFVAMWSEEISNFTDQVGIDNWTIIRTNSLRIGMSNWTVADYCKTGWISASVPGFGDTAPLGWPCNYIWIVYLDGIPL